MRHKIRNIISVVMFIGGLLLMAGSVGAMECGDISVKDGFVNGLMGAGTTLLAIPVSGEMGRGE